MSWIDDARASSKLRPFPLAPLARRMGLDPADTGELALRLGLNRGTVKRYRVLGLDLRQADEWAHRAGLHPGLVWPHWERVDLAGLALVNAGKETCGEGHPLDRVDYRGRRRCGPCPRAAWKRYRVRKSQVAAVVASGRQQRAPLTLLDGGMAQAHGSRERLVALLPPEVSQRVDELARAAGLSRSAWACMTISAAVAGTHRAEEPRGLEVAPEQAAS